MKAIVQDKYGSPEVLEFRDNDKPEVGENDVLVRVRASGINPADWAIMGGLPYTARLVYGGLRKPQLLPWPASLLCGRFATRARFELGRRAW